MNNFDFLLIKIMKFLNILKFLIILSILKFKFNLIRIYYIFKFNFTNNLKNFLIH